MCSMMRPVTARHCRVCWSVTSSKSGCPDRQFEPEAGLSSDTKGWSARFDTLLNIESYRGSGISAPSFGADKDNCVMQRNIACENECFGL